MHLQLKVLNVEGMRSSFHPLSPASVRSRRGQALLEAEELITLSC